MKETLFLCDVPEPVGKSLRTQGYRFLSSATARENLLRLVVGEADLFVLQGDASWMPSPRGCMETLAALKSGCRFAVVEEESGQAILHSIKASEVLALLRQAPALAEANAPYEPQPPSSMPGGAPRQNRLEGLGYRRAATKAKAAPATASGGNSYDDEVDNKDSETVNEPVLSFEGRAV